MCRQCAQLRPPAHSRYMGMDARNKEKGKMVEIKCSCYVSHRSSGISIFPKIFSFWLSPTNDRADGRTSATAAHRSQNSFIVLGKCVRANAHIFCASKIRRGKVFAMFSTSPAVAASVRRCCCNLCECRRNFFAFFSRPLHFVSTIFLSISRCWPKTYMTKCVTGAPGRGQTPAHRTRNKQIVSKQHTHTSSVLFHHAIAMWSGRRPEQRGTEDETSPDKRNICCCRCAMQYFSAKC